jgi:hypothetical protein
MTVKNADHDIQFGHIDDERFESTDGALFGLIAARRNV